MTPFIASSLYEIDQAIYDTVWIPPSAAPQRRTLFTIPIGAMHENPDDLKVKTSCDTNMHLAGQLPLPRSHKIHRYTATLMDRKRRFIPLFSKDGVSSLWSSLHFSFTINNRYVFQAPIFRIADPNCLIAQGRVFPWFRVRDRLPFLRLLTEPRRTQEVIDPGAVFTGEVECVQRMREPVWLHISIEGLHCLEVQ